MLKEPKRAAGYVKGATGQLAMLKEPKRAAGYVKGASEGSW